MAAVFLYASYRHIEGAAVGADVTEGIFVYVHLLWGGMLKRDAGEFRAVSECFVANASDRLRYGYLAQIRAVGEGLRFDGCD